MNKSKTKKKDMTLVILSDLSASMVNKPLDTKDN